ncbi:DUF2273 domain-containing protein [Paenibacillus sp. NFR01]|uniref:DUF2273 domain-containing protein n=1 Tax=Paenibacillus sp. NFR01 TaxID=1566279 RepID=UPI0008B806E3|nr:DUF2273 domain-containing protein [Paenibacillus sp. NFR01]SET57318.1 Small integral membrane protein [Paenibacillus sp. NFR01]
MLWKEIWERYAGRITGTAFGAVLGLIYLISGFWDMLFFALVVFIGYTLGKRKDAALPSLFQWEEWASKLSGRWRPFK